MISSFKNSSQYLLSLRIARGSIRHVKELPLIKLKSSFAPLNQLIPFRFHTFSTLQSVEVYKRKRENDRHANYIVTGGNRGIGLQFVKSLLESTEGTIIACCRQPSPSLNDLSEMYGPERLKIFSDFDIEKEEKIAELKDFIKSECNSKVDILLNVIGILHDINENVTKSKPPERTLKQVDKIWLKKSFNSNTIGPVMLIQALEPFLTVQNKELVDNILLESSKKKNKRFPSIVVNLSARVGSISDNSLGGWISYRMSKAALNMATKTISIEYKRKNIYIISMHPGTTDTDLSKPFQKNVRKEKLFTPEYSVSKMMDVIFHKVDEETTGSFFAYDGSYIEW